MLINYMLLFVFLLRKTVNEHLSTTFDNRQIPVE
jgi:hypothetical protein